LFSKEGDTVTVGGELFKIELGDVPAGQKVAKTPASIPTTPPPPPPPAVSTPPIVKSESKPAPPKPVKSAPEAQPSSSPSLDSFPGYSIGVRTERAVCVDTILFYMLR
jgi:2-oxoglutarate dehydrogenase E2 component (dihydrolipoamide succinyltransferase)